MSLDGVGDATVLASSMLLLVLLLLFAAAEDVPLSALRPPLLNERVSGCTCMALL
jgi:hypothetical protein